MSTKNINALLFIASGLFLCAMAMLGVAIHLLMQLMQKPC